jgi:hypothetical protein
LAPWLVLACYLIAAVVITGRLWVDLAGWMQAGDRGDVDQFGWFVQYTAAVSRGRLPALFTTAMNAPVGVNLMWNTSFLLPGVSTATGSCADTSAPSAVPISYKARSRGRKAGIASREKRRPRVGR